MSNFYRYFYWFLTELVYENQYYLPLHLDKCAYKLAKKQIADYLDDSLFETD